LNGMYIVNTVRAARLAYSPDTQYVYMASSPWPLYLRRYESPRFFSATALRGIPGVMIKSELIAFDTQSNKVVWRVPKSYAIRNGSGFLASAGGVLFHGEPDGKFEVYNAESGDLLWDFQTGSDVSGSAVTYEVDGEQYVAAMASDSLWAFKIGGTVAEREPPPTPPTETSWTGRVFPSDIIEMGTEVRDSGLGVMETTFDEYAFAPQRSRVAVNTEVTWSNNGKETHTIEAQDGSWTTGPVPPGQTAKLTFSEPGVHTYICRDHPWSYGEITIDAD